MIDLRIESDQDFIVKAQGWGPQVAARTHGGFKNFIPVFRVGRELKLFFAFGDNYGCDRVQYLPGLLAVDSLLAGVASFGNINILSVQELLGFFT